MTIRMDAGNFSAEKVTKESQVVGSLRFDWTIHLWLGTTFVAGIAGFLLSFFLVPPEVPEKAVK